LDDPIGDGSILPTFLLCKTARKKVKVALGGDGADELFAGYDPFRALRVAELYEKVIPKPIHKGIRMLFARLPVSHRNMSLDFKVNRTLKGLSYPKPLWNPVWLGPLSPHELQEFFSAPFDLEKVYSEALEIWENCRGGSIVDQTLQFYTRLYLKEDILVKVDRASMMNSLEVRAPFLDIELVDFVRRIPHRFKFHKGKTKYILKKALERLLPGDILHRPKKGFGMPLGLWYQSGKLRIPKTSQPAIFNFDFFENRLKNHLLNLEDNRSFLFNMHVFTNWFSKEMNKKPLQ
jgi:asparagine synthase (glutamine-hydrolysing)